MTRYSPAMEPDSQTAVSSERLQSAENERIREEVRRSRRARTVHLRPSGWNRIKALATTASLQSRLDTTPRDTPDASRSRRDLSGRVTRRCTSRDAGITSSCPPAYFFRISMPILPRSKTNGTDKRERKLAQRRSRNNAWSDIKQMHGSVCKAPVPLADSAVIVARNVNSIRLKARRNRSAVSGWDEPRDARGLKQALYSDERVKENEVDAFLQLTSDYFALAGKSPEIAEAEAHGLKSVRPGLKVPTIEGLSRLARRDYKEKRDGGRVQNSPVHGRSCGINVCTCSVPEIQARRSPGAPKLDCARRPDIVHCPLNIFKRYSQMRARNSRTPNIGTRYTNSWNDSRRFIKRCQMRSVSRFTLCRSKSRYASARCGAVRRGGAAAGGPPKSTLAPVRGTIPARPAGCSPSAEYAGTSRQKDGCSNQRRGGDYIRGGHVRCVRAGRAGLGRCTRMHKELKPRSMSETGHLPTDVESSGRDPGAATLQPGPYPALPSSPFSFYLALLSLSLFLLLAPDASEPSDSPRREPLSATLPYVNRIQYSPPASGPPPDRRVFFEYKRQRVRRETFGYRQK
ncbi:hypothetical protein DBV15_00912 [Temnothorax longispinosus]|uniref:Uncharacterized protein n=1 Tax=Temnothorax longispinosus TaxID=300112 RepID=A0A4S2JCX1_9HYME|nr:hypothetical protein DBV15_00912 [Temnothorax longispinosus]